MMKCKLDEGRVCNFSEGLKREPNVQDCFCCLSMGFRVISTDLIKIIADIGAGHLSGEFMDIFREFSDYEVTHQDFIKKCYPGIVEEAKKGAVVSIPSGSLPKEVEEVLMKYINKVKTGDGVV